MKIALVFDGIGYGGIERIGIDYAKIFLKKGYNVDIYNLDPSKKDLVSEVPSECKIINKTLRRKECMDMYYSLMKKWKFGKFIFPLIYIVLFTHILIKKTVIKNRKNQYDIAIAISGHYNDLTFVTYDFINSNKKICWLHGGLADYLLLSMGFGFLYNKIKNLVVLTNAYENRAIENNKFLKNLNINKVYNPTFISTRVVDDNKVSELRKIYGEYILMVGRLSYPKNPTDLIKAFNILKNNYNSNLNLVFLGDGELKEECIKLTTELDLDDRVFYPGSVLDVQNYYKGAKIFVLSSISEGLPTVIIEAMHFGLPIVSTNCFTEITEILGNNKYGISCPVNDFEKLAESINFLCDEENYKNYRLASIEKSIEFLPDNIEKKITEVFENLK